MSISAQGAPIEVFGPRDGVNERTSPDRADSQLCYEEKYQSLGHRKGPKAERSYRRRLEEFWANEGETGLRWIIRRLSEETHGDLLDSAASLLADAGPAAASLILDELERNPETDQAIALWKALGWMADSKTSWDEESLNDRLRAALNQALRHPNFDVRSSCAYAARLLPNFRGQDQDWLEEMGRKETNPYVRATIADVLGEWSRGETN